MLKVKVYASTSKSYKEIGIQKNVFSISRLGGCDVSIILLNLKALNNT